MRQNLRRGWHRTVYDGKTDQEITKELIIGIRTVNTHVGNILDKT